MREYGKISPRFWTGETGRAIRATGAHAQIVALYLMSAPLSNMAGLYYLPVPVISHETGVPLEGVERALRDLDELGFAVYDFDHEVVWVRAMAVYQVGKESLKPGDKQCVGVRNAIEPYAKSRLFELFLERYGDAFHLRDVSPSKGLMKVREPILVTHSKALRSPSEGPSEALRRVANGHEHPSEGPSKPLRRGDDEPELPLRRGERESVPPLRSQEQEQEQEQEREREHARAPARAEPAPQESAEDELTIPSPSIPPKREWQMSEDEREAYRAEAQRKLWAAVYEDIGDPADGAVQRLDQDAYWLAFSRASDGRVYGLNASPGDRFALRELLAQLGATMPTAKWLGKFLAERGWAGRDPEELKRRPLDFVYFRRLHWQQFRSLYQTVSDEYERRMKAQGKERRFGHAT